VRFGGLSAVSRVSLQAVTGEILSLIGPNGAGKTTIFNVVSGLYRPTSGTIALAGVPITDLPPHARARLGVSRTFQNIRLFREMTVLQNVRVARYGRTRAGVAAASAMRHEWRRADRTARELLERIGLADGATATVKNLPYGDQKRVEIARALATEPRLLLLDEPAAGMSTGEASELMALIRRFRAEELTVLLVEHHLRVMMEVSDRVAVLDHGELIAVGGAAIPR
jgi:branched-chain amino acid transport system ATP-binding protein